MRIAPGAPLWFQGLGIAVSVISLLLLAAMVRAAWGVLRKHGPQRRQWLLRGGAALLLWVGIVAGYYTVLFRVYLPAAGPDPAYKPGTLTHLGSPAPDFSLKTLEGTPFQLTEQRGNVVLLNFFATWCGPCQAELPHLQRIWTQFRVNQAFRMLVMGREETAETVGAFRAKHGFTFPLAADPDGSTFRRFASELIPRTYLIARDGTILYQSTGYYKTELAKLETLIAAELKKEPAPAGR